MGRRDGRENNQAHALLFSHTRCSEADGGHAQYPQKSDEAAALDTPTPLTDKTDKTSDPSSHAASETARIAALDAERNARDRALGRGYDYARVDDENDIRPAELVGQLRAEQARDAASRMMDSNEDEIDRLAAADGWSPRQRSRRDGQRDTPHRN
jgi:hypothetical protein